MAFKLLSLEMIRNNLPCLAACGLVVNGFQTFIFRDDSQLVDPNLPERDGCEWLSNFYL